jgi:hypothetical protein
VQLLILEALLGFVLNESQDSPQVVWPTCQPYKGGVCL